MPDAVPPPPDPPAIVEDVEVRAALPHPIVDQFYAPVRVVSTELVDYPRLDEALKTFAGVSLFRRASSLSANPTTQGLSLRSIAPSGAGRALVLLDNVPQNDPFGGWVIWSSLPSEGVEKAQMSPGGAGSWGAGALTGVVAIDEQPGLPGLIRGEVSAGERGYGRVALAGDLVAPGGDLLLVASSQQSGGWIPVRAGRGAVDAPLDLQAWSASARLNTTVGKGVLATRLFAYDEARGTGVRGGRADASGHGASLTYVVQPFDAAPGWRLQAWVRDSDFSQTSLSVAPGRNSAAPANSQDATPAQGIGVNAALLHVGQHDSWEIGFDARRAEGETRERFRYLAGAFTRDRVAGGSSSVAGVYAEGSRQFGLWSFAAGARIDAWKSWDGRRLETDRATGVMTLDDRPRDRDGVLPTARLAARRTLGDGLYLRAAAYEGFRPPTLNELHRPFRVGNDVTESNPDLRPERLYGVEAGIGGDGDRTSWSATVFLNRLDDAVTNVTVGFGPGTFPRAGFIPAGGVLRQRANAGMVNALGLEINAERRLGHALRASFSLSATDAEVDGGTAAPQLTGKRPAQAPRLAVTAGAIWHATDHLDLDAHLRWESARFEDDLNSRVLSPALTADASAAWSFGDGLQVYVAADNLFDAAVETGETADGIESFGEPRSVRIGLRIRR